MNQLDASVKKLRKVRTYAEDLEIGKRERDQKNGVKTKAKEEIKLPEVKVQTPSKEVEKKTVDLQHVVANIMKPKTEKSVFDDKITPKKSTLDTEPGKDNQTEDEKPNMVVIDQKTLDKFAPVKTSLVDTKKDNEFVIDDKNNDGATIITDNKKDRFRFFPAVKKALAEWFTDYKEEQRQKKIPKYTVPDAEMRKGVIQKATSRTGRFATSDFSNIQDRIRQREEYEKRTGHITWSANTESGYPLLPGKVDTTSNVKMFHRKGYEVPAPAKVTPITISKPKEKVAVKLELPIIAPEPKAKPLPPPIAPRTFVTAETEAPFTRHPEKVGMPAGKTPIIEATERIHLPTTEREVELAKAIPKPSPVKGAEVPIIPLAKTPTEVLPPTTSIPPPPKVEEKEEIVPEESDTWNEEEMEDYSYEDEQEEQGEIALRSARPRRPWNLRDLTTNTMTIGVVAIIAFIGVGIVIVNYFAGEEKTIVANDPVAEEKIKSLLLHNLPVDFVVLETVSGSEVQKALTGISGETKALVFIKPGTGKEPIANTELLSLLTDSNNAGILASLKQIYFGRTDLDEPFVLIKISDEISARGGMLNWEKTIHQDFLSTFSLTATSTPWRFVDKTQEETDVRILIDKDNNELLTYGLISNMIIITTDSLSFGELVSLIK